MTQRSDHQPKATGATPSVLSVVYGGVACLALWLVVLIPGQVGKPVTLFGAAPDGLSPDTMPRLVLIALACVAGAGAIGSLRDRSAQIARPSRSVILTCLASFAFAAVLVPLGFVVASALTVVLVALYLGGRHPMALVLSGLAVPVTIYLIFTRVLHIALPPGLLGV